MDTSQKSLSVLSLCAGYGGIEKSLERVFKSVSVVAYVEIEAYAVAGLVDKMEKGLLVPAPVWTDIKTFNSEIFRGSVDMLCGGYPCQPFSQAGKRKGADDERHLWPHIKRIIGECEPKICFFENVEGHISLGLETVLSDLGELGYRVEAGIFSAAEVGAPHRRKRVFVLGYSKSDDERRPSFAAMHGEGVKTGRPSGDLWPARPEQEQFEWEEPRII